MSNTTPHSSSTPRPQPTQAMALQASSNSNPTSYATPEEDADDVVLLGSAHHLSQFTAQRSRLLKIISPTSSLDAARAINVLLGEVEAGQDPHQHYVPNPHHHLRSLWTETTEPLNTESFVWGIFDDHTYALSALRALPASIARPAIEADIQPFTKLRKVDMRSWMLRIVTTAQSSSSPSNGSSEGAGPAIATPSQQGQVGDVKSTVSTPTPTAGTMTANSVANANPSAATSAASPFAHLAMPTFSTFTSWLPSASRPPTSTQNGDQTGVINGINKDNDGTCHLQACADRGGGHQQASALLNSTVHPPPHQCHAESSNTLTQRDDYNNGVVRREAEKEGGRTKVDGEREKVGTSLLTGEQAALDSTPVSNSAKPLDPPQLPLASLTYLTSSPSSSASLEDPLQPMLRDQAQRTPRSSVFAPVGSRWADASTDKSITAGQRNRGDAGYETKRKTMAHHTAKLSGENYQALSGVAKNNGANNTWGSKKEPSLPCERKEAEAEAVQATGAEKGKKRRDEGSHERVVAAGGPTASKGQNEEEPTIALRSARHDSLQTPSFCSVAPAAADENSSWHQTPEKVGTRYQQSYLQQPPQSSPINESSLPPAAVAVAFASTPSIKGTRSIASGGASLPLTDSNSFASSYSSPNSYLSFGAVTDYSPSSSTDPHIISNSYDLHHHHNHHQPCNHPIPLRDCDRAGDADESLMGTEAPRLLVGGRAKEVNVNDVGGNSGSGLNAATGAREVAADTLHGTSLAVVRNTGVGVVAGGDRENLNSWSSGGIDSRQLGLPFSNADATPISTVQLPQKQTRDVLGHASVSQPQQISTIVTLSTPTTATGTGNTITQRPLPSHHHPHSGTAITSDGDPVPSMENLNIRDAFVGSGVAVEDGPQDAAGPFHPTLSSPSFFQYPPSQPTRPRDASLQGQVQEHNGSFSVGLPFSPAMSNQNNHAHINHNNTQASDDNNNSNLKNSQDYTSGVQFVSHDDTGRNDSHSFLPSTKSPFPISPSLLGDTNPQPTKIDSKNSLSEVSTRSIPRLDISNLSRRERALDSPSKGYGIGALGQSGMSLPDLHGQAEKRIAPQTESKGMSMGMGSARQRVDSSSMTNNAVGSQEEKSRPDAGLIRPVPLRIQEVGVASFMKSPAGGSPEPTLSVGGNGGPLSPTSATTTNQGFSSLFPSHPMMATSATSFRQGDWLCSIPACGAHNFARNMLCIVCGANRTRSVPHPLRGVNTYPHTQYSDHPSPTSNISIGVGVNTGTNNGAVSGVLPALAPRRMGSGVFGAPQAFTQSPSTSTFPNIPRLTGMHQPSQTTAGDSTVGMNDASIEALGGMGQVAAIREAIKAHQTQSQLSRPPPQHNVKMAQSTASARGQMKGSLYGDFVNPFANHQGGQLLIPTTLGNSSPTSGGYGPSNPQESQLRSGMGNGVTQGMMNNPAFFPTSGLGPGPQSDAFNYSGSRRPAPLPRPFGAPFLPSQPRSVLNFIPIGPTPPTIMGNMGTLTSPISPTSGSTYNLAAKIPPVLTPSGRNFALGGRVQNVSRDDSNPIIMFWPENEPLPLSTQIRPPTAILMALGGINGPPPPILNTGNKGPIDAQPGDWTCGKCDYLNWRRRRVCANCFPHAEGNTEGTKHSSSDVQERVALLASVLFQQQQQVQQQQQQIQAQQAAAALLVSNVASSGNLLAPNLASMVASLNAMGLGNPASLNNIDSVTSGQVNNSQPSDSSGASGSSDPLQAMQYTSTENYSQGANTQSSVHPNLPPRLAQATSVPNMNAVPSQRDLDAFPHRVPSFNPFGEIAPHDTSSSATGSERRSPPSSRSSFSAGSLPTHESASELSKLAEDITPSPLPLLPAFLQEVVGETSGSSASSLRGSSSSPSSASTSSMFGGGFFPVDVQGKTHNEMKIAAGYSDRYGSDMISRRDPLAKDSPTSAISSNLLHRRPSQSSIWSLGFGSDVHDTSGRQG